MTIHLQYQFFSKVCIIMLVACCLASPVRSQGCSDAGFCTLGNHNANDLADSTHKKLHHEIDFGYTFGRHGKNERFHQPQLTYRLVRPGGSYFESRLPYNIARDKQYNVTSKGIGDMVLTYNSKLKFSKKKTLDYTLGFRVSFTNADKQGEKYVVSYPMFLQNGLGTTDLIAVINYDIIKYLSVGGGIQVPVIQYNKNSAAFSPSPVSSTLFEARGYRRQTDALLKISGHYTAGKFRINGGPLAIFHLGNDYYKSSAFGKWILQDSKGVTVNITVDCSYQISSKWALSLLVAEPIKTRKNIPDGLARSLIISPKLTYGF